MPRKKRKNKKKVVPLYSTSIPTFCGFRLVKKNINRMWRWDTLEDIEVKF